MYDAADHPSVVDPTRSRLIARSRGSIADHWRSLSQNSFAILNAPWFQSLNNFSALVEF
jgi:hypothetical protein